MKFDRCKKIVSCKSKYLRGERKTNKVTKPRCNVRSRLDHISYEHVL